MEKRCANIGALDKLLRDQFIGGVSADYIRWDLQEQMRDQRILTFNDIVVETVVRGQEEMEATVSLAKKSGTLYVSEEALAPFPLLALQIAIRVLTQKHGIHATINVYS